MAITQAGLRPDAGLPAW